MDTTMDLAAAETAECRRLAELLRLDVVGVARIDHGRRRVTWWTAPGAPVVPLALDEVLEGRAEGWIACPRGSDVIFARLNDESSVGSVSALRAMLVAPPPPNGDRAKPGVLGGVAPEDPIERERKRWAYAIHDGLTQVVTAAVLDLESQARRVDIRPDEANAALRQAAAEMRRALEEIRSMLAVLSPETPGPHEPLEQLVQGVLERWQLPASWSIEGDLDAVPLPVLEAASSVIRESVANAAKHSQTSEVAVKVHTSPSWMEVRIEDRGRGFRVSEKGLRAGHLGMEIMRRRVAEVHGTLDIESAPGRGTRVIAHLPVPSQGENQ